MLPASLARLSTAPDLPIFSLPAKSTCNSKYYLCMYFNISLYPQKFNSYKNWVYSLVQLLHSQDKCFFILKQWKYCLNWILLQLFCLIYICTCNLSQSVNTIRCKLYCIKYTNVDNVHPSFMDTKYLTKYSFPVFNSSSPSIVFSLMCIVTENTVWERL